MAEAPQLPVEINYTVGNHSVLCYQTCNMSGHSRGDFQETFAL